MLHKFLLSIVTIFLTAHCSWAAIAFDAAASANVGATAVNSLTFAFSCTNNNTILIVGISNRGTNTNPVLSVTYNGVSLTLVAHIYAGAGQDVDAALWRLLPTTNCDGTNHNIVVTLQVGLNQLFVAGAMTYTGVDQTTPLGTSATNSGADTSPATVNVSSASGEVVVDVVAVKNSNPTVTSQQTERWTNVTTNVTASANVQGKGSEAAGAATVTMSYTISAVNDWAIAAVPMKPAAAAARTPGLIWIFQ